MGINNDVLSPHTRFLSNDISTILDSLANLADTLAMHPKRFLYLVYLFFSLCAVFLFAVVFDFAVVNQKRFEFVFSFHILDETESCAIAYNNVLKVVAHQIFLELLFVEICD